MSNARAHNLKRHMFTHTGVKAHLCSECKKSFGQAQHLKEHMLIAHPHWRNIIQGDFFNCSALIIVLKRKTLFDQWGSFVHQNRISDWLPTIFHFGTENWEEQLKKSPCINHNFQQFPTRKLVLQQLARPPRCSPPIARCSTGLARCSLYGSRITPIQLN